MNHTSSQPATDAISQQRAVTDRGAVLALMGNRNFSALWIGQVLSQIGDRFRFVAILVIVNELTGGDPLAISLLTLTVVIPQFVFGL